MTPIASNSMEHIFGTIMDWHFNQGYDASIKPAAWHCKGHYTFMKL